MVTQMPNDASTWKSGSSKNGDEVFVHWLPRTVAPALTALTGARRQCPPVQQYLVEAFGEARQRRAVDDFVVDADVQMNDLAFDCLAVDKRELLLDRADAERHRHRRYSHPDGDARREHAHRGDAGRADQVLEPVRVSPHEEP